MCQSSVLRHAMPFKQLFMILIKILNIPKPIRGAIVVKAFDVIWISFMLHK